MKKRDVVRVGLGTVKNIRWSAVNNYSCKAQDVASFTNVCANDQNAVKTPELGARRIGRELLPLVHGGFSGPLHLGQLPNFATHSSATCSQQLCSEHQNNFCLNSCSCLLNHFMDFICYKRQTTSLQSTIFH